MATTDDLVITPGQLWAWDLNVGDGWWPFTLVSEAGRSYYDVVAGHVMMTRGDKFIIVATDDPGPAKVPGSDRPQINEWGEITSWGEPPKRWHVAMGKGVLFWISQDMFGSALLIRKPVPDDSEGLCADISARDEANR